jgi:hypothetical protein
MLSSFFLKELSRKHEIPKTRKEHQQLDSIGISFLDTDYTDGYGLGLYCVIRAIRAKKDKLFAQS